jgi:hypothetical protein
LRVSIDVLHEATSQPPIRNVEEVPVRFLMLVCRDLSIELSPEQRAGIGPEVEAWVTEMEERGVRLQGDVLAPVEATATVSVRASDLIVERGPRAETDVSATGYNLIECSDLDEAIEVSAKHPIARFGLIELRPIVEA